MLLGGISGGTGCDQVQSTSSGSFSVLKNKMQIAKWVFGNHCDGFGGIENLDAESLTYLSLGGSSAQIQPWSSIQPLSVLTNLNYLNFSYATSLKDLNGLSSLTNLETLGASHCAINDVSALSGLTNLKTLNLSYNKITNITAIGTLTGLTSLNLQNNSISDLSPLKNLINPETGKIGFTSLNLSNNSLEGTVTAGNSNVETLRVLHNAGLTKITITGNNFNYNDLTKLQEIFGTKNVIN